RLGRVGRSGQHAGAGDGRGTAGFTEVSRRDHGHRGCLIPWGASKGPPSPRARRRPGGAGPPLGRPTEKETRMREARIVASSRTPLAKSFRGAFNMTRPDDFTAHTIKDVLGKVPQLDAKEVEDVIMGCGQPHGSQGHNIARVAAMRAGLPVSVAGLTLNRFCSS